jgi:hypothetical protein
LAPSRKNSRSQKIEIKRGKLHCPQHIGNKSAALELAIGFALRTSAMLSDEYSKFLGNCGLMGLELGRVDPSSRLLTIVSHEQDPARIISAFANRKDSPRWNRRASK